MERDRSFGLPRFEHREEAIIVPIEVALSANYHWGITHEIMHVLQVISPDRLSSEVIFPKDPDPVLSMYRTDEAPLWPLINEIMADVLDFALCCPVSINCYLDTVWGYLSKEIFESQTNPQARSYLFRSFAAICYSNFVLEKKGIKALGPKYVISLLQKYFPLFKKHDILKSYFEPNERNEIGIFLLAQEFTADIIPALTFIFLKINEYVKIQDGANHIKSIDKRAIEKLKKGKILTPEDLSRPDVLAWMLGGEKVPHIDKISIAWILSLWHAYHIKPLGPDLIKLAPKKVDKKIKNIL